MKPLRERLKKLQKEKSNAGGGDVNDFPGCDGITEAAAPSRKPPPKSGAGGGAKKEMWAQVAAQLLKTQDKDGDGQITHEEVLMAQQAAQSASADAGDEAVGGEDRGGGGDVAAEGGARGAGAVLQDDARVPAPV